ncbi:MULTISPECIES: hypothetical protein [unclassified Rhizobium]|uniref:hypothetical protein n=1 Tax=unclassified Rhizobium TaxID=2613769 RepID=UPI0013C4CA8E|nr:MULTISPECIES: hypothetical protein [unclassified Rhizobium]
MSEKDQGNSKKDEPRTFAAEDVRQGEIILKRRWQRVIFIGGLAAMVLIILLVRFAG